MSHTATMPATTLPVEIKSTIEASETGALSVALISCEPLHLRDVIVSFDPPRNRITLIAPCGCESYVELSGMLLSLAHHVANAHPPSTNGITTH